MPNDKLAGLLLKKDSDDSNDDSETQPLAPPAPPPIKPATAQNNPYDFITNPTTPAKKRMFTGGNSLIARLAVIGGGVVILLMIGIIIVSLLNSGSATLKDDYSSLVLQQTELIRVSDIGVQKARQSKAKNLAITSKLSLTSQQSDLQSLAKKAGASINQKFLATGIDPKTDTALTSADQENHFDEEFIKILTASLQKYQKSIKIVYDASTNVKTKNTLSKNFNAVNTILGTKE